MIRLDEMPWPPRLTGTPAGIFEPDSGSKSMIASRPPGFNPVTTLLSYSTG